MIPGGRKERTNEERDRSSLKGIKATLQYKTEQERTTPSILNGIRKARISKDAGRDITEINRLIKQFAEMQKMMKMVQNQSKNPSKGRRR